LHTQEAVDMTEALLYIKLLYPQRKIPVERSFYPFHPHPASRFPQLSPVVLPLVSQRTKLRCKYERIRKAGKILRQKRGEIWVQPVLLRAGIELYIIFHLYACQEISRAVCPHRLIGRILCITVVERGIDQDLSCRGKVPGIPCLHTHSGS